MLLTHFVRRAASRAACTAGKSSATRTPMMAIDTKSSTSVTPRRWLVDNAEFMSAPRKSGLVGTHFWQLAHVPDFDRVIAAARNQALAVGCKGQAGDQAGMAAESADGRTASVAVPDLYGAVRAGRGEPAAIGVG